MGNGSIAAALVGTISLLMWLAQLASTAEPGVVAFSGLMTVALYGLAAWLQVRHKHRLNRKTSQPRAYAVESIVVVVITAVLASLAYMVPLQNAQATPGRVVIPLSGQLQGGAALLGQWRAGPNVLVETSEFPETLVHVSLASGSAGVAFTVILAWGESAKVECGSQKRANWVDDGVSLRFKVLCPIVIPFEDLERLKSATLVAD
jgi:hypothetical protein